MFIGACECGTRVYSTRTGPGMAVCFLYGVVRLCTVKIYTEACALHFPCVYVRYSVWLGQPKQCILYVYVCMYGGRHVQSERCITRRECVYACNVQYMAWAAWVACVVYMSTCACTYVQCLCHLDSVLTCAAWRCTDLSKPAACTGMDSVGNAPIVLRPTCLGSHAVLVHVQFFLAWTA